MKTILKFVGYLVGSLLMAAGLIAIVLYIMGLGNGNTQGNIITTMPPVVTASPDLHGNTTITDTQQNGTNSVSIGTPTPVPTPTPDPETVTPSPEVTSASTAVTPTPAPAATPLGSGKLSTKTGYWLDLDALWTAESIDNETAKVTVTVNLRSFSLITGANRDALEITVDGETATLDVEAIRVLENVETTTKIGEYSFTVDAPVGRISLIPIEARWHFGGTYSGQSVPYLVVEGNMELER